MKGKARARSIAVYARLMRVRVASRLDFPKCCAGTCVLGLGVGPGSPHQSVLGTALQNHNIQPPLSSRQQTPKLTTDCLQDRHRIESHPVRWCPSFWLLPNFIGTVTNNPRRKLAGRQLFLFLPGRLNIHNRATWCRVHRRNGAPMRKARLFTTWVSGAGETIQGPI